MNALPAIDEKKYGRVLSRELPRPIRSDRELERAIARLEDLDERDESLSPEERELAELYTSLIEAYLARRAAYPFRKQPGSFAGSAATRVCWRTPNEPVGARRPTFGTWRSGSARRG
jgi:hypothetical protein